MPKMFQHDLFGGGEPIQIEIEISEEQQAHFDAAADAASEDHSICTCGKLIVDCDEAYEHITSGC